MVFPPLAINRVSNLADSELSIPAAGQKDRRLWGRECAMTSGTLGVAVLYCHAILCVTSQNRLRTGGDYDKSSITRDNAGGDKPNNLYRHETYFVTFYGEKCVLEGFRWLN